MQKFCRNSERRSRFFPCKHPLDTRNGFSLLSGCQREFFIFFFSFLPVEMSFPLESVKSPAVKKLFSSRQTAIPQISVVFRHSRNDKKSGSFLENLRGIVRQAKVRKSTNSVVTDLSD